MSISELIKDSKNLPSIMFSKCRNNSIDKLIFEEWECMADMIRTYSRVDHILLKKCEGISESSACTFCDDLECFFLSSDSFSLCDVFESIYNIVVSDFSKVESEWSRSDCLWYAIDLCRRKDELHMTWWLFERLQKCIECWSREHMDFIYDIYFEFSLIWLESCSLDKLADIIDSCIARSIDLDNIEHSLIREGDTVRTFMTRVSILDIGTIDSLCEDACTTRLTRPTWSMKKIGMMDAPTFYTISQYGRDVVLSNDRIPIFWTIYSIEGQWLIC